jgi:hypothetical protein
MAELSGFNTLGSQGLADWDADVAICLLFDLPVPPTPTLLGWGMQNCFPSLGLESLVRAAAANGRRALASAGVDLSGSQADELRRSVERELEFTMLARQSVTLPGHTSVALPPAPDSAGARFQEEQETLRSSLGPGATPGQIRDVLDFLAYRDSDQLLADAAMRHGLRGGSVAARISSALDQGDSSELGRVVKAMPIQGAFTELRVQAHLRDGFGWAASDCVDFLALATVAPLVDAILVDRRTFNLAAEANLRTADVELGVHRRLADLCDALRFRLGACDDTT